jgi:hypothetical protein
MQKTKQTRTYSPEGAIGRRLSATHQLQMQAQRLTAELVGHRQWLTARMQRLTIDCIEHGDLVVSRKVRHNWEYSPELEAEIKRIKKLQRREQEEGIATDSPTVYVSLSTKFR